MRSHGLMWSLDCAFSLTEHVASIYELSVLSVKFWVAAGQGLSTMGKDDVLLSAYIPNIASKWRVLYQVCLIHYRILLHVKLHCEASDFCLILQ